MCGKVEMGCFRSINFLIFKRYVGVIVVDIILYLWN